MINAFDPGKNRYHIGFLDALRGFLAFWVYYAHLKMATIGKDVLWGSPSTAVDGFMLLSGFLMAYHWILREERFESFKAQVKDFYLRRFFRITPLFYSLLTVALVFQNQLSEMSGFVNQLVPKPWKGRFVIFDSPKWIDVDFLNVLTHYSYTFGLFPKYVASNILPDWSISLEMQFYVLFPLLILLISKMGSLSVTFAGLMLAIATNKLFGLYNTPGMLGLYPRPSMILFRINIFIAGMAIAYAYLSKDNRKKISWIILGLISIYGSEIQIMIIAAVLVFLLIFDPEGEDLISKIGSWKVLKFFGDISYSVYLVHILIMYPMLYLLFNQDWFLSQTESLRLVIAFGMITPLVYLVSFVLFKLIEQPGIRMGKKILTLSIRKTN